MEFLKLCLPAAVDATRKNFAVALDWEVITENAKPKFENDMVGGRRPSRRRPGAARFRIELIERSARDQLDGEATVDFLPRGVVYTVICSLEDKS